MRGGVWHQFGDRSQKLSREQIDEGVGDGVIISPRDLGPGSAERYSEDYHDRGVAVAVDPQFHVVQHTVGKLGEWDFNDVRLAVDTSKKISDKELDELSNKLRSVNRAINATCVIAPGLIYEPGRPDIVDVNRRLFAAAKRVGNDLGIPTLGTIVVGKSGIAAPGPFLATLSDASSVAADGWYYAIEFDGDRIPNDGDEVFLAARGILSLAAGGKPVLQAFSGPFGLVGLASGATAVTVGHAQNLWQFTRERWVPSDRSGGGGDAPSRLFSRKLWGTIVYPDEIALLSNALAARLVETSPFADPLSHRPPFPDLPRWEAGKHLVWLMGKEYRRLFAINSHRHRCSGAIDLLKKSHSLHAEIRREKMELKDGTDSYQQPWLEVLRQLQTEGEDDFDLLELLN